MGLKRDKMTISVINIGFFKYITHKYNRFRQPRFKFPSLFFLFNLQNQNPLFQYRLLKNMNILLENKNYHVNHHRHFFLINLLLRISPPSAASPARDMIEKIYFLSKMTHPTRLSQQMMTTLESYRTATPPVLPGIEINHKSNIKQKPEYITERQKTIPGQSISHTDPEHVYRTYLEASKTSSMLIHSMERMPMTNRTATVLPQLMMMKMMETTDFYHTVPSLTYPGIGNISHIYRESKSVSEAARQPGPENTHRLFPTKGSTDLYYFAPLNLLKREVSDLKKPVTSLGKNLEEVELTDSNFKGKSTAVKEPSLSLHDPSEISKKPKIDLGQLTDQVYHMLERKIRIEKERRGW
jgi:hypothetical protein